MSRNSPAEAAPIRVIDRILGIGALTIIAIAVLCFLAIMIGTAAGMQQQDFDRGLWPVVGLVPMWALPLGLAMIVTLLVMTFIRNGRAEERR